MKLISRSRVGALLTIPLLIAVLSACSPDTSDQIPNNPPSVSSPEQDFMDWQLDFASCMRGEGIDMPDPKEGGATQAIQADELEAFDAASKVCLEDLGEPPVPGGQQTEEEVLESQLELTECLRENGADVEDPKPGQALGLPEISEEVAQACGLVGGPSGGGN